MTDTPILPTPATDAAIKVVDDSNLPGEKPAVPVTTSVPVRTASTDAFMSPPAASSLEPKLPAIEEKTTEPTIDLSPSIPATPAAPPLVVTEAEVKEDVTEHQKLAEEIEILTGEIQALEAKIERLSASASAIVPEPVTPTPLPSISAPKTISTENLTPPLAPPINMALPPIEQPKPLAPEPVKMAAPESLLPVAPRPVETGAPVNHAVASLNFSGVGGDGDKIRERQFEGIYPKRDAGLAETNPLPPMPTLPDVADAEQPSVLGTIGEIVGIIGVVLLVLMLLSPLFKETLDPTLWTTVRTFGWLSAVIGLFIGFVLSMFQHGKWGMKIFLLVVLVLAGLLYYSINNPGGFLEPVLGSLLTFYL